MLLTTFLAFTAFGFGIWLIGHLLFMREDSGVFIAIAAIGAILVMTTGGAVALDDIERQTGEVVERDYEELANETNENRSEIVYGNNQTRVTYERTKVSMTEDFGAAFGQLGFGGLQMIVGALLLIRDLEEVSF